VALDPEGATLEYTGRPTSAAPAVGSYPLHISQLNELLDQAWDRWQVIRRKERMENDEHEYHGSGFSGIGDRRNDSDLAQTTG
jgi:hypothetical protein